MKLRQLFIFMFLYVSAQSVEASYNTLVRSALVKPCKYIKLQATKAKNILFGKPEETLLLQASSSKPQIAIKDQLHASVVHDAITQGIQANCVEHIARTQFEQPTTVTGGFNFHRNTIYTTTHITHNHNHGAKTWAENFFAWMKDGGQGRAMGLGLVVGTCVGYGLHGAINSGAEDSVTKK